MAAVKHTSKHANGLNKHAKSSVKLGSFMDDPFAKGSGAPELSGLLAVFVFFSVLLSSTPSPREHPVVRAKEPKA